MAFFGISKGTLQFLARLSKHNDRRWFADHEPDYHRDILEPARALVVALEPRLRRIDPELQAVPEVNGSIMRLSRDLRFFPKQAPFKDYLDLWFWYNGERSFESSGFFLRMSPTRLTLGGGIRRLESTRLAAFRRDVCAAERGEPLASVVASLRKKGYEVAGETYRRPPQGVDHDHPRVSLLKHSALYATWSGKYPAELRSAAFVGFVVKHFTAFAPLHAWLKKLDG